MALSYRARKRLALAILLLGLPAYIVVAVTIMSSFDQRPPIWIEVLIYVALGVLWALPFRSVFKGIGREDPGAGPTPPRE